MDDIAFVNDHLEPTQDFDWNLVEPEHHETISEEIRKQCAVTLAKFSRRLLELGGRNRNQFFIAANCFAFAAHMHPDQKSSGEEIARKLRLTKAAFFKRVNQCRDVLKLPHIAGARSSEARKTFKRTAKKHHEKRKARKATQHTANFIGRLNSANQ